MMKDSDKYELILIDERKIYTLLPGFKKNDRFEASGLTNNGVDFFVVFDNLSSIARIKNDYSPHGNSLLGHEGENSDFEGITFDSKSNCFYALVEYLEYEDGGYYGFVHQFDKEFTLVNRFRLNHKLAESGENFNKGYEGLAFLGGKGASYLPAIPEATQSNRKNKKIKNSGEIHVYRINSSVWKLEHTISLPDSVRFKDYSGMAIRGNQVAIVSQSSSKLWVGSLDKANWQFIDEGYIYQFPKNKKGKVVYGNIEGVSWMSANRLVVVSDKCKRNQPKRWRKKDQSIHIFDLP